MIGKLRRKFILVTMCSTFAVLLIIVGTLNLVSYQNMKQKADAILEILAQNDGNFPKLQDMYNASPTDQDAEQQNIDFNKTDHMKNQKGISAETPFETRFFSVKLNASGESVSIDTGKIASVKSSDAVTYAQAILDKCTSRGFYSFYRYQVVHTEDGYLVVFVDRSRELSSFQTLAIASISMSLTGLLAVFGLVVLFSKIVFQPVAASYEKQKQFITDASHELKTPLTIISANVEVLEMEAEESPWTKSIRNQVTRLTAMVEQMVSLSRMDESDGLKERCQFDLSDAVRETAELFLPVAANQGKELQIEAGGQHMYLGDERLIRQMVSLLVDNAVKYSSECGQILVKLAPRGRHYQLSVWNTVEAIQSGNLEVLFERFYRLDSSRNSSTGGSGIGLSIVKAIAEAHKGKATAVSEDGRSLLITILL